jgi:hypothetical protein
MQRSANIYCKQRKKEQPLELNFGDIWNENY